MNHHNIGCFKIISFKFCLFLVPLLPSSIYGNEARQNYRTDINAQFFLDGKWIDQVRDFSANHSYASAFHPDSTVSFFNMKHFTNCGYYVLEGSVKGQLWIEQGLLRLSRDSTNISIHLKWQSVEAIKAT